MPKTKHGHRSRSPSPSSKKRERKREDADKERDEKRRQKELMKALETPEEKRARRIQKKEDKERRKRAKMGWDEEMMGYTNVDNPFGDQHLLDTFVWHKKREKEVEERNMSEQEVEQREKKRLIEMKSELEKVKKRRIEREKEREAREDEMSLLQRMKEADMFKEWENHEDKFHLEQAKMRSKIRIESGRAKPIDLLAKYINTSEDDIDIEMQEPYHLLRGLNIVDLEDLLEDIKVYLELEKDIHYNFWKDMVVICEDEVAKLKKLEQMTSGASADRREGIHAAVSSDVAGIFKGKTYGQLVALEQEITARINSPNPGDVTWWESTLQQLKAHLARTRLRDRHQANLRKKLFQLKQEQAEQFGIKGPPLFPAATSGEGGSGDSERRFADSKDGSGDSERRFADSKDGSGDSERRFPDSKDGSGDDEDLADDRQSEDVEVKVKDVVCNEPSTSSGHETKEDESDTLIAEEDLLELAYEAYDIGAYSPKLLKTTDVPENVDVVDSQSDKMRRDNERKRIMAGDKKVEEFSEIEMVRSVGEDGIAEEEYNFNSEITLGPQQYLWHGKYRPRKPRFFNRVHTGFEWNKYNQTHYDTDNPPPKIVQGYKFNIFYPDLIDKRKTPNYTVTPMADSPDFAVLKFHAGAPYEDIAFKIVNREWEYSWKYGFKSQFNNNILQLWFRFKRYRYRR